MAESRSGPGLGTLVPAWMLRDCLGLMHEISRCTLSAHEPRRVIHAALVEQHEFVPGQRVSLTMFDFELDRFYVLSLVASQESTACAGSSGYFPMAALPDIEPLLGGHIHSVPDLGAVAELSQVERWARSDETHSYVMAPLLGQSRLIGSLNVESRRPHAFTEEHLATIQAMADQLAIAISQTPPSRWLPKSNTWPPNA